MKHISGCFAGVLCVALLLPVAVAQAACGTISYLDSIDETATEEVVIPAEACENPFNADVTVGYVPNLMINGEAVSAEDEVVVAAGEALQFAYAVEPAGYGDILFVDVYQVTTEGYTQLASHFGSGSFTEGLAEGEYMAIYVSLSFAGMFGHVPVVPTWQETLKSFFLPQTTHAFYEDAEEVTIIPFSIVHEVEAPAGASSVLFLPGIQASRLYTDGLLETENQLWEPNRDNDVEKLGMTEAGASIYDIYTKDVVDEVHQNSNVYKSFLKMLDDMKEAETITDYEPFAYDWRYNVFDVATKPVQYPTEDKLLLEELQRLASESHTGKVTIIGHSNGGLVAKALLHTYGNNELAGLVDKVVMVGTPQLGTPKAVGSLLHGLDQNSPARILITQTTAREATRNMPGAYGLMPTAKYFSSVSDSFITHDGSEVAAPFSSYGDLSTYEKFRAFVTDENNTRGSAVGLNHPISLNPSLLAVTADAQQLLDDWSAPDGVEVYEVAGTGNPTIDGFHYREFNCKENINCILKPFLKPVPTFTLAGDQTVVLESATAYEGDRVTMVVDLKEEGDQFLERDKTHANLTESDSVQTFVESVIYYPYLTDTIVATEFTNITQYYTIIAVHSPVSIVVRNEAGQAVGMVDGEMKEEIDGSQYIEFAGSKYVLVPAEEVVSVILEGETAGRYSVTVEQLGPDGQVLLQEMIGATSTPSLVTSFDCTAGSCGSITADYDGDGTADAVFGWVDDYQVVAAAPTVTKEVVLQEQRSSQSSATRVASRSAPAGIVAGVSTQATDAELAQMWSVLLQIQVAITELTKYYNLK